jgi:hypothetical protein
MNHTTNDPFKIVPISARELGDPERCCVCGGGTERPVYAPDTDEMVIVALRLVAITARLEWRDHERLLCWTCSDCRLERDCDLA